MRWIWTLFKLGGLAVALVAVAGLAALFTVNYVTTTRSVQVPELVGLHPNEATRRLNAVDLRIQFEEDGRNAFDETIPSGHVLRQEPPAGTWLKQDRAVKVSLSLGPHDLYVPRVVGESVSAAQVRLQQAGLAAGEIVYMPSRLVAENVVVDAEPTRLTPEHSGRVNLLVSAGGPGPRFVMPDLIGRRALRVRAVLEMRGFRVQVQLERYEGVPGDTVIRQQPLAGHPVVAGDTVRLWASPGGR